MSHSAHVGGFTFGEIPIGDAADAILAHSLAIDGERWPKGRRLNTDDVARAAAAGIATVVVARLRPEDVAEDAAAAALAATLAGAGVATAPTAHGRTNLVATVTGLLSVDTSAIDAVNAVDEGITVGTLPRLARVSAGEVVATVKIIPFAVAEAALDDAMAAAAPLRIAAFAPKRFVLIQTILGTTSAKMLARTDEVTRARVMALGGSLDAGWVESAHDANVLAATLVAQPAEAVLLIAGASATADRRDVIPAAIVAAGGQVERLGMPVDPGNLLCLGSLGDRAVIGLPGCARSPKRNGFDWVLERLAAGIATTSADIAAMGVGGLLPEAERPQPRVAAGVVGVVILAAGRSTRMGSNKLLAVLDGKPVIAHVVDAVAAAGLPPPILVLGHCADAVRTVLGERAVVCVNAPDFANGMSRSLAAGLAAAPADWTAAIVALGDMPLVAAATFAALAAGHGIRVPTWAGKRGNPVAWSRAYWPQLAAIVGDTGGRALLAASEVVEVAVDDPGILADVDTPAALAELRAGLSRGQMPARPARRY